MAAPVMRMAIWSPAASGWVGPLASVVTVPLSIRTIDQTPVALMEAQ